MSNILSMPAAVVPTETIEQKLARLEAENAALKSEKVTPAKQLKLVIGKNGALCVLGLGRFPVMLYKSQWVKLLAIVPQIQEFLKVNDTLLADKAKKDVA